MAIRAKYSLKQILQKMAKMFSPMPFLRYTGTQIKKYKWGIILLFIFFFVPVAFSIDLSWGDPTANLSFVGSMDEIPVSLTDTLGTYVEMIYIAVLPIGQALAVLYWLIQFGEVIMRADLTPELICWQFLKIAAFLTALEHGWEILTYIFEFFNESLTAVTDSFGSAFEEGTISSSFGITFDGLSDVPWYEMFPIVLEMGAFQIFRMFCCIVTSLIVWTRKLKLLVFAALLPIGVSDYLGGTRSACMRYIKKLIALGLQGLIMYIIAYLTNIIIYAGLNQFGDASAGGYTGDYVYLIKNGGMPVFSFLITCIPPALAMLAAFNKSEEISNGVIGAH